MLFNKIIYTLHCCRLTFCPTNLGTAIRASVHIKLPLLASKGMQALQEVSPATGLLNCTELFTLTRWRTGSSCRSGAARGSTARQRGASTISQTGIYQIFSACLYSYFIFLFLHLIFFFHLYYSFIFIK